MAAPSCVKWSLFALVELAGVPGGLGALLRWEVRY